MRTSWYSRESEGYADRLKHVRLRRRHCYPMALILVSMALSCRSGEVDKAQYTLRQAGFRVLYMAPVYIAMEKGLFQKEGIDFSYTEIDSGALGVATVISGDVDISDIDPTTVARLRERGQSLIMFYNIVNRVTMDLIVRNEILQKAGVDRASPLETRYRVLDGLNIGVTRPGAAEICCRIWPNS